MPQPPKRLEPGRSARHWFGAELRSRRIGRAWKQRELAALVHVSADLIRKIETADRRCTEDLARRLDTALGTGGLFSRALLLVDAEADRSPSEADKHQLGAPPGSDHPAGGRMLAVDDSSQPDGSPDPVDRRSFLAVSGFAALLPAALPGLVRPLDRASLPRTVSPDEIQQIMDAASLLSRWDNHYGGAGIVRETAMAQLQWTTGLLQVHCSERLRPQLFAAAARLGMVVGATAFDACGHTDARQAFAFAAVCAEEAGEWHLRAKIYSFRARQEIWVGNSDSGLTYAELGLARADRLTATERAMLHTARARALAKMGDVQRTLSAIGDADDAFAQASPQNDPPWMGYYDEAQHHGDTGHALYDLAALGEDPAPAGDRLLTAINGHTDQYMRSRAISRTKLASLTMMTGDPDQALVLGHAALDEVGRLHSRRVADDVRELARLTASRSQKPEAVALRERIAFTLGA
ncbi:helix-turn-helix domain-containing protein [Streptosporangium sp. KLBMP 9127]|nr:helix-turn-helix domain-containing protein [Streptosporangium sp. KLBMP 9127]